MPEVAVEQEEGEGEDDRDQRDQDDGAEPSRDVRTPELLPARRHRR
jgi:hypothetical protein